jgi:hypothetical protein
MNLRLSFSEDGRRLYFLKNAANFNHWTIVISTYRDGRWGTPEVAPFSGQFADADVVSAGGGWTPLRYDVLHFDAKADSAHCDRT